MDENGLGEQILGCALRVHRVFGPALLESAYESCLAHELAKLEIEFERQLALPLIYDSLTIESAYRLDLLVDKRVVVEIKAVDRLTDVHRAQLLSYLKLGAYRLNVAMMRDGIHRMANGL